MGAIRGCTLDGARTGHFFGLMKARRGDVKGAEEIVCGTNPKNEARRGDMEGAEELVCRTNPMHEAATKSSEKRANDDDETWPPPSQNLATTREAPEASGSPNDNAATEPSAVAITDTLRQAEPTATVRVEEPELSLPAAAMALGALARLRMGIRHGYEYFAKRLGVVLTIISGVHNLTLVFVLTTGHGVSYTPMTNAISSSAFVLHAGLTLAHSNMYLRCTAHFCLIVMDAFIRGAFDLARRDYASAAYLFIGWGLIMYPLAGWGLREVLRAALKLDRATKDVLSRSTIIVFMTCAVPMVYCFSNGLLCIAFVNDKYCAVRTMVNHVTILALLGNAIIFILLKVQPISLKQVTHLDIAAPELLVICLHGILLGLALALHSQNESFGRVAPAVTYMDRSADPCLILVMVAFAVNITRLGRAATGGTNRDTPAASITVAPTAEYGTMMVPYRVVLAAFTALYLAAEAAASVGEIVPKAFSPLSLAAAVFHIWMRAEEPSVSLTVKLHYFAQASSATIDTVKEMCDGEYGGLPVLVFYTFILYPGIFSAVTRFRSSVRSHGNEAAAKLAATSFVVFWSAVVPVTLYLGADSLGAFLPRAPLVLLFPLLIFPV